MFFLPFCYLQPVIIFVVLETAEAKFLLRCDNKPSLLHPVGRGWPLSCAIKLSRYTVPYVYKVYISHVLCALLFTVVNLGKLTVTLRPSVGSGQSMLTLSVTVSAFATPRCYFCEVEQELSSGRSELGLKSKFFLPELSSCSTSQSTLLPNMA